MASARSSPGFWASRLIILDKKILTVSLSQTDKYEDVIKIIYQKNKCYILQIQWAISHLWATSLKISRFQLVLVVLLVDIEILRAEEQWSSNVCLLILSAILLPLSKLFQSTTNTILTRPTRKFIKTLCSWRKLFSEILWLFCDYYQEFWYKFWR